MIFISAGTLEFPFPRLVSVVYEKMLGKKEKVVIQSGYGCELKSKKNITVQQFFTLEETIELYKKARINVSAAGEGSCMLLSQFSKNIFYLVPRLAKFNEHVDDQQLEIARYFSKKKQAVVVEDTSLLSSEFKRENQSTLTKSKPNLFSNELAQTMKKKLR